MWGKLNVVFRTAEKEEWNHAGDNLYIGKSAKYNTERIESFMSLIITKRRFQVRLIIKDQAINAGSTQ